MWTVIQLTLMMVFGCFVLLAKGVLLVLRLLLRIAGFLARKLEAAGRWMARRYKDYRLKKSVARFLASVRESRKFADMEKTDEELSETWQETREK